MTIRIVVTVLAILCAIVAFCAKPLLSRLLKREPDEREIVMLKAVMFLFCIALAMTIILPDYM